MNQIQLPETYAALSDFRKNDVYLPEMNQAQLIAEISFLNFYRAYPALSDITGAFMEACSNRLENFTELKLLNSFLVLLCTIWDQEMTLRNLEAKPICSPEFRPLQKY